MKKNILLLGFCFLINNFIGAVEYEYQNVDIFEEGTGNVTVLTFSQDSKILAVGSIDGTIKIFDLETKKCFLKIESSVDAFLNENQSSITAITFSPDKRTFAFATLDGGIKIWNLLTREQVYELDKVSGVIHSMFFSADGKVLVAGFENKTIKILNSATGEVLKTFVGHGSAVSLVDMYDKNKMLLSASNTDGVVKLWNLTTGKLKKTLKCHLSKSVFYYFDSIKCVATVQGNNVLFFPLEDEWMLTTMYHCCRTKSKFVTVKAHHEDITCLAFSSNKKIFASASLDNTCKIWDLSKKKHIQTLSSNTDGIVALSFSPDGETLVSASKNKTIVLWKRQQK